MLKKRLLNGDIKSSSIPPSPPSPSLISESSSTSSPTSSDSQIYQLETKKIMIKENISYLTKYLGVIQGKIDLLKAHQSMRNKFTAIQQGKLYFPSNLIKSTPPLIEDDEEEEPPQQHKKSKVNDSYLVELGEIFSFTFPSNTKATYSVAGGFYKNKFYQGLTLIGYGRDIRVNTGFCRGGDRIPSLTGGKTVEAHVEKDESDNLVLIFDIKHQKSNHLYGCRCGFIGERWEYYNHLTNYFEH